MSVQARLQLTAACFNARLIARCFAASLILAAGGCPQRRPAGAGGRTVSSAADNSECLICHMDFKAELISARHEQERIRCTDCHGPSLAHGDDEMNITPPDKLFGRAEVVPFCKTCHRSHKKGKAYDDFVEKWNSRRRPNGRMILDDSVCTDCHGNHAILRPDQRQMTPEG